MPPFLWIGPLPNIPSCMPGDIAMVKLKYAFTISFSTNHSKALYDCNEMNRKYTFLYSQEVEVQ